MRARWVAAALVLVAAGCVKWGPTDHWHRSRSGMELFMEDHIHGYAECPKVYPGIEVYSAKLQASLLNGWVTPDCEGDFSGAIREAITAAGLTELKPPDGHVFRVVLFPEHSVRCGLFVKGKQPHEGDNCVSVVQGDVVILAAWWSPHEALKKAFIALRDGPPADQLARNPHGHGYEWWGERTSVGTMP